jgi:hypothetical protein
VDHAIRAARARWQPVSSPFSGFICAARSDSLGLASPDRVARREFSDAMERKGPTARWTDHAISGMVVQAAV